MSLSYDDLQAIHTIVEEMVAPIRGDIEALSNEIRDIYEMGSELQKNTGSDGSFQKLSIEKKILRMHAELVEATRQAGVTLPSH